MLYRILHHKVVRWIVQHKATVMIVLGIIFLVVAGIWFWGLLVAYIGPKDSTDRKDVVQVFALIIAGLVGAIGGIVGIANLQTSRRNLQQQRELEEQRAEEDALQSYFEQMGDLLTNHNLIDTDREDIRQLAQAQTLTVLARINGSRKGAVVRFLYGAGLINRAATILHLTDADLHDVNLSRAKFRDVNLSGARLYSADLIVADFINADLRDADLSQANLYSADLREADLRGADLSFADVTEAQLTTCKSLKGATLPNSQKYEDWLKTKKN